MSVNKLAAGGKPAPASAVPKNVIVDAPEPAVTAPALVSKKVLTEEELTNQRNEAKKRAITEKTEDAYWRAIKRIKRGLNLAEDDGDMDFLLDYDAVHKWVEELTLSNSSKKTYYIAIHHTIESLKDSQFSAVAKLYDTDMMAFIKRTQRPSKKKKTAVITWNDILEIRKSLEKKAAKDPKNFLLDYVIIAMYTLLPPSRCEYVRMKMIRSGLDGAPVVSKADLPAEGNYILLRDRSAVVVYSDCDSVKAPAGLVKILHTWAAFNKSNYLFVKVDGKPMLKNTLSQRILSIFQREADKKLGINAIRKAYVASVRNETEPEVKPGADVAK